MTRAARAILFLFVFARALLAAGPGGENTWDYCVQVTARVSSTPAIIELKWEPDSQGATATYSVSRKRPGDKAWGPAQEVFAAAGHYVDTTIAVGQAYEYRIVKRTKDYTAYGYIQSGIEVPAVENRGIVLLMVERSCAVPLATELARLEQDLVGDGWQVRRHHVGRSDSVASVKALIQADCAAEPDRVKSVFLFGHVPVPYSGKFAPDAHPDHAGAWPADVYYADLRGEWTDRLVNFRQTLNRDGVDALRQNNVPGDGKFDQSVIPGAADLAVGRVDFANLPGRVAGAGQGTFPSEIELLRQYLNKDHAFRHGLMSVSPRAVVGDYFGVRGGEAFAASGYRSFSPLVGSENVAKLNLAPSAGRGRWISTLADKNYLVAYGCGYGTYRTIQGLGRSGAHDEGDAVELVRSDVRAVFTLIYGSWLGDWDNEDNFMRAILASPTCTLTAAWSGRPHWFMHPMGLGETIGHVARLTQNNDGLYQNQLNGCVRQTHIALLGDPTLRLQPAPAPQAMRGERVSGGVVLSWSAPAAETVLGYHVYCTTGAGDRFERLTEKPIFATKFAVQKELPGARYMIRAVRLEQSPSGTYFNASQGVFWPAADGLAPVAEGVAALSAAPVQAAVLQQ